MNNRASRNQSFSHLVRSHHLADVAITFSLTYFVHTEKLGVIICHVLTAAEVIRIRLNNHFYPATNSVFQRLKPPGLSHIP